MEIGGWEQPEHLFASLVKAVSKGKMEYSDNEIGVSKAFRVTLPDQQHNYFINQSEEASLKSCAVTSISFR